MARGIASGTPSNHSTTTIASISITATAAVPRT